MSEWIRIRVKDFYKDAVGELEYTYVTREVYEALADTFRKEAHAQEMRDIRHTTKDGYTEGETEELVELTGESVEDTVIRQMEIETLQKAMQSLTPVQRERLHFYFFEGMTYRQIAAKEGYDPASKRCDGTGHRSAHRATGGCGRVYPFFYGSSQLYRWISLRQQDFLLSWFQSGAAGSGLYTGCVLQDIAGKAAGSIAGVRRDHFFTQPHAQQEPETG